MSWRRAGFFVFAAVSTGLTLWIAAELVGFDRTGGRHDHRATFADATGLRDGDPVRVSGVPVGEVTSVGVERGRAVVGFAVDEDVPVPVDSVVAVRSRNLVGMRELVITPGGSERLLADGDPIEETDPAVDLGALVNELGPLMETASPQQINQLVRALNDTLDGDGHIQQLLDNLLLLTETFDASDEVLRAALTELPEFTTGLDSLLDANAASLDSLITDLASLLGHVSDNAGTIGDALAGIPTSAASLYQVASRGDALTANFECMAMHGPPCPPPPIDGNTLEDVLQELNAP